MSIFDALKNHQSQKTFDEVNQEAIRMFDQQKHHIHEIKTTEGYQEIKRFFEREKKAALDRLMSAPKGDENAKAVYQVSERFLEFLTIRER